MPIGYVFDIKSHIFSQRSCSASIALGLARIWVQCSKTYHKLLLIPAFLLIHVIVPRIFVCVFTWSVLHELHTAALFHLETSTNLAYQPRCSSLSQLTVVNLPTCHESVRRGTGVCRKIYLYRNKACLNLWWRMRKN